MTSPARLCKTMACKDAGECSPRDGRCQAVSDADCRLSKACKYGKQCTAKNGHCVE